MRSFLDQVILDNTIRSYIVVGALVLVVFIFKRILSRYLAGLIFNTINRITRGIDKKTFVKLVVSPLELFVLLALGVIIFEQLTFPHDMNWIIYKVSVREFLDALSVIVLIITFVWLLLRIMDFIALILHHRSDQLADPADNQLIVFFKDFFKVILVIFGILLVLKFAFHYSISNLLTGLSIVTAAIALATRESLENLIASFIIFFDKPFTMGDVVKVHDITGTVERIGLRSTRIRTEQKTYVTVPNKQMVDSIMDNLSLRTQRRALTLLELHAETPQATVNQFIQRVKNVMLQKKGAIESHTVFLEDINKNAFIVHIEFFTAPIPVADFNEVRQTINLAVIGLLEEMNIHLAERSTLNA